MGPTLHASDFKKIRIQPLLLCANPTLPFKCYDNFTNKTIHSQDRFFLTPGYTICSQTCQCFPENKTNRCFPITMYQYTTTSLQDLVISGSFKESLVICEENKFALHWQENFQSISDPN